MLHVPQRHAVRTAHGQADGRTFDSSTVCVCRPSGRSSRRRSSALRASSPRTLVCGRRSNCSVSVLTPVARHCREPEHRAGDQPAARAALHDAGGAPIARLARGRQVRGRTHCAAQAAHALGFSIWTCRPMLPSPSPRRSRRGACPRSPTYDETRPVVVTQYVIFTPSPRSGSSTRPSTRRSCAPSFVQLLTMLVPPEHTPSWLVALAMQLAPGLTIAVEAAIPALIAFLAAHAAPDTLGLLLHLLIAVTPPPNNAARLRALSSSDTSSSRPMPSRRLRPIGVLGLGALLAALGVAQAAGRTSPRRLPRTVDAARRRADAPVARGHTAGAERRPSIGGRAARRRGCRRHRLCAAAACARFTRHDGLDDVRQPRVYSCSNHLPSPSGRCCARARSQLPRRTSCGSSRRRRPPSARYTSPR